jgi:5-(carboxyamino)imidazole ribonucleotide synthase
VITLEWENVPVEALEIVAAIAPVRPGRRALEVAQDRLAEKDFLRSLGLAVAPYAAVAREADLPEALARVGEDGILKTRRLGYDGKGQHRFRSRAEAAEGLAALDAAPAIAEGRIAFEREISVVAARGLDGAVVAFDPGENVHGSGILRTTTVPAAIPPRIAQDAILIAGRILNGLDYVGVLGVELFVTRGGLLVNEIAPRVHNTGHWTIDACLIDQFEQHVRAVAGWPLGDGARHSDAVMTNILGAEIATAPGLRDVALHLYGKSEARPGRKMGHYTRLTPRR